MPDTATVTWAKLGDQSGISYTKGSNTGFIQVDGVTVEYSGTEAEDDVARAITSYNSNLQTSVDNATVTVTGTVTDATSSLSLDIPSGVTVKWQAFITTGYGFHLYLLKLNGDGCFEVPAGGTVSAIYGNAIEIKGENLTVKVDGGTVSSISSNALDAESHSATLTVNGGRVSVTEGNAIYAATGSTVTINGGIVSSTEGNAIYTRGESSALTVNGGVVFAYGSTIIGENQVAYQPDSTSDFIGPTGNGVVIAWNKDAGNTTYCYGDDDTNGDLIVLPFGATVEWTKKDDQSGISYTNSTNMGFLAVGGVTVNKIGVMIDAQDYQVANNYAHTYSFDLTTLLLNTAVDASQVSAYTITNYTNANNVFSDSPSVSGTTLTLPVAAVAPELTDTVTIGLTSDYYIIPDITINIKTKAKALVTISADMTGGVYSGQPYTYSNAAVVANTDSSDVTSSVTLDASYVGIGETTYGPSATAPTNAGSYQLTLSVPDSNITYCGSQSFTFTIEQRPVTIKADNKSMTVGGTPPILTYTVSGQLSGEAALEFEPILNCNSDTNTAGSFEITVSMMSTNYAANYTAADPAYVYGTLTVTNPSTSGGSSSGGGSSGGGIPPTSSPTVTGSTAATSVTATVSSNGTASASVSHSQMNGAIKAAQEAAQSTGGLPWVEIQVSGGSDTSGEETTLPHAAVEALLIGEMEALTISGSVADMTFDAQAIAMIADNSSGKITFASSQVEHSDLSDAALQVVGDRPIYQFSVTCDSEPVSEFGGTVTVSVPYTPAAGEDHNAIVAYYINADGEPELMQNCYYNAEAGVLVFTTTHFSQYAVGYNKITFSDVSDAVWYSNAVSFLAAHNITSGTTDTTFSPDATMTRGQFITLLMRAYAIEPDENTTNNFSDAGNTYYTGYLAAAKRLGITSGEGDNKFAPEQSITRQDMFTLLYNALNTIDQLPEGDSGKTLSAFTDSASISSYAQEAMTYLVETGVVGGNNGQLSPTDSSTRAQTAQVLFNLLGK